MRDVIVVGAGLLLVSLLSGGCSPTQNFDSRLRSIVKPYGFSVVRWELRTITDEAKKWISTRHEEINNQDVIDYFSSVEQLKNLKKAINSGTVKDDSASLEAELNRLQQQTTALKDKVGWTLRKQIKETLAQEGIFNPLDRYIRLKVNFPPLNFKLEKPPHLLIISPRDRIESMREIPLNQDINLEEMEGIEARVDELGVSSLVVELGGFSGTYPTFVTNEASLRFTIDTVTEEWLHQCLTFTPLGFLYLLDLTGVSRSYEIATMAETLASMVSREIGAMVCQKYYPHHEKENAEDKVAGSGFDFNREMREIRRQVDKYLAQGEIKQAEEFMEQKRQYLASMGYYIRKLNQAYFAFYGTYADRPTSISPIGAELRELRSRSASLRDFLNRVGGMTSHQELRDSIK